MYKHRRKVVKYTGDITLDKCKNKVKQTLNQGDRIETPDYIRKHNMKIEYKYYLDKQSPAAHLPHQPAQPLMKLHHYDGAKHWLGVISTKLACRQGLCSDITTHSQRLRLKR